MPIRLFASNCNCEPLRRQQPRRPHHSLYSSVPNRPQPRHHKPLLVLSRRPKPPLAISHPTGVPCQPFVASPFNLGLGFLFQCTDASFDSHRVANRHRRLLRALSPSLLRVREEKTLAARCA
ncbi:hypothetical protein V8G54_031659 [Vigna mungo]|uniref:Uncharacterized protein n=1 Tax=Vigna mungo TaxID=3915 RepID=A0AAQ3MKG0_VIGMU